MPETPFPAAPDLAALVGSRICHDLISPLGAIGNGVELLQMEAGSQSPELALIVESILNANARIRFFRVAFGAAVGNQRIARTEVMSILADLTRGSRLVHSWTSAGDLSRREVRLVFLLLQCLETAMPYGGRVEIEEGATGWTLVGTAPRLKVEPGLWQGLTEGGPDGIVAGNVQFALVPGELSRQGRRLAVELGEGSIRLGF